MGAARLPAIVVLLAASLLGACSQNFGPAPPGGGSRVTVARESMAGPVLPKAAIAAAARGNVLWLGTDGGLYRVDLRGDTPAWRPSNGGFYDAGGIERVASVDRVIADPESPLGLHLHRSGGDLDALVGTDDGGSTHFSLDAPNLLARSVLAAAVLPPSGRRAAGAWLVAQGGGLFLRAPGDGAWTEANLPETPLEWGPIDGDRSGTVWTAVRTDAGWELWRSTDGGGSFAMSAAVDSTEGIVALASSGEEVAWVDVEARVSGSGPGLRVNGHTVLAADLRWAGGSVRWTMLTRRESDGQRVWFHGTGADSSSVVGHEVAASSVPATLSLLDEGAVLADADGTLHRSVGTAAPRAFPFSGGELDWGSLGADPSGRLILGQTRSGEVFVGEADDPTSMQSLGTPQFQSEARSVMADPSNPGAVFSGSYGCFWNDGSSSIWENRSAGQSSYLSEDFAGPISVQALAADPAGPLWLGGLANNGPYRSLNGGQSWQREHLGLGEPGSFGGEEGLPLCTQVRAFSFDANGETLMGTFRGGVWRFDDETSIWSQENRGLPDLQGAPVDTCCLDPDEHQVDVRDLVHLDDGSALAATGWGVFRRAAGGDVWEESNFGLTNGDLFAFAVHPGRGNWVVAAGRGTRANPDWLFFSRDGGNTWTPVASSLPARWADDIVWISANGAELVATLQAQGAWRLVLDP